MAGSLALSGGQSWPPSHVQVTVHRARGLRAKGKHGSSDAFVIIQLGKEKFCTAVLEKSVEPVWKEECTYELMPNWLEQGPAKELVLTVMHRSLMGLDKFLGQLSLPLATEYQEPTKKPRWYKLSSKPGQKKKERGELQVSIQFVRNNLTASMFDLSSKEKPRSALDRLKDKVKGKKKHDGLMSESASAIVSSSVGQITSDEEFGERGTPEKKSKKSFFSKPKLHRSSLTKSNSSLSSQQSVRSLESVGSSTGVPSLPSPKATAAPGLLHAELVDSNPSLAKVLTHKRALSDEVSQVIEINTDHLAPKTSPISRSLLCINGSHVYSEEHSPKHPSGLFPKSSPLSHSLQNVAGKAEAPGQQTPSEEPDGQQWTATNVEKPEVRVVPPVITVNDEESRRLLSAGNQRKEAVGSVQGTKPVHVATPIMSTVEPSKNNAPHETKKPSIFPFGSDKESETRRSRTPSPVRKSSSLVERTKPSGWFLKEASHKPSLTFGSQGLSDESIPSASTAGSSGKDLFAVEISAGEEAIPYRPPPSALVTTANVSSFRRPEPSARPGPPIDPDIAMQSADFHSPGLDAEVRGQEAPLQWVPTRAVPVGDLNAQVPSAVPREMTIESLEDDEHSSTLIQATELNVEMSPSIAQIHTRTKSSSTSINLSGLRAKDDMSSNLVWDCIPTDSANRMDLKIHSVRDAVSPVVENVSRVEGVEPSMEMQSGTFSDRGLDVKTSCVSLASHQEQTGHSNVEGSSAPTEDGRSTSGTASKAACEPRVINSLPPAPAVRVTDPRDGSASLVPVFPENEDHVQDEACPDSPPVSQIWFGKVGVNPCESRLNVTGERRSRDTAVPGEGGHPEVSADKRNVASDPLDELDIHLKETGPLPPKPPRLLACTDQAVGDTVEKPQDTKMPFDYPAAALQLSEDRGFEQKASLVVSSPAADEVNPERTDSTSTPSAAEEPVRPSNDVVTKEKASCGTFELSLNEKTGVEHFQTCLSTFSVEGINTSIDGDGNLNKLDVLQQPLALGLIEVHQACQLIEIQPAMLKTTENVNSLETASLIEERLPTSVETRDLFPEEETSLAWRDQTDQSEQDFMSATEDLPHKSSPVFSECERTLTSGEELSGKLQSQMNQDAGKKGESSTLMDSKETLTGNAERETRENRQAETVDLRAGIRPLLCSEPLAPGMKMEQRGGGEESVLEEQGGGGNYIAEQPGGGEEFVLEQPGGGEEFVLEQPGGGEEFGLEQRVGREESVLKQRGMGEESNLEQRGGGEESILEKRGGGEESILEKRGGGEESILEKRGGGEESVLAENLPSGLCPPLTVKSNQGQVTGKADDSPHNSHLSVRNTKLQTLGDGKPVAEEGSSAASRGPSAANDSSFEEELNFEDLHLKAAPPSLQAANLTREQMVPPAQSNKPLAFSTPYPVAVTNSRVTVLPSPILFPSNGAPPSRATQAPGASQHSLQSSGSKVPPLTVLPEETQPAEIPFPQQRTSPHPVKPITATALEVTEKKSARSGIGNTLTSGLEKLKNVTTGSISPMRLSVSGHEEQEAEKESKLADPVLHYYHLTHDELIKKILQQESELRKKEEHVQDLEEYIDLLLVQIMEQNPSILQSVSEKMKNKTTTK